MADAGVVDALLRRVEAAADGVDSIDVAGGLGVDHQGVVGAVKSLLALGDVSLIHTLVERKCHRRSGQCD